MADFKTHVTTSSVLGIGYAGAGMLLGAPIEVSMVAGGLCGIGGMLPDLDSDTGVPLREAMAFSAALVPMLLVDRFEALHLSHDAMVLAAGSIYLLVRFGMAAMIKKYTVHRGMFHSIPAAILFGELAFLICGCQDLNMRFLKSGGLLLGVMSHLALDELYSIEWKRGRFRLKKSFGTAVKFWGRSLWGNISCYGKLIVVTALVFSEPMLMERYGTQSYQQIAENLEISEVGEQARQAPETIYGAARTLIEKLRK